jgi:hypothetical protein
MANFRNSRIRGSRPERKRAEALLGSCHWGWTRPLPPPPPMGAAAAQPPVFQVAGLRQRVWAGGGRGGCLAALVCARGSEGGLPARSCRGQIDRGDGDDSLNLPRASRDQGGLLEPDFGFLKCIMVSRNHGAVAPVGSAATPSTTPQRHPRPPRPRREWHHGLPARAVPHAGLARRQRSARQWPPSPRTCPGTAPPRRRRSCPHRSRSVHFVHSTYSACPPAVH